MNRERLDDLARDNQAGALVDEAFHILAAVYPMLANVLWQFAVEQLSVAELKKMLRLYRTRFLGHKFVSCGGPE